eukprot:jgi/Mesvir1/7732/Mv11677-RA.2
MLRVMYAARRRSAPWRFDVAALNFVERSDRTATPVNDTWAPGSSSTKTPCYAQRDRRESIWERDSTSALPFGLALLSPARQSSLHPCQFTTHAEDNDNKAHDLGLRREPWDAPTSPSAADGSAPIDAQTRRSRHFDARSLYGTIPAGAASPKVGRGQDDPRANLSGGAASNARSYSGTPGTASDQAEEKPDKSATLDKAATPDKSATPTGPASSWVVRKVDPYLRLARAYNPAGSWLLFWPCAWSITLAAPAGEIPDLHLIALFGAGAVLLRSAGCIINDMWDRDIDSQVERTKTRPLASGELTMWQATVFLGGILTAGLGILLQLNTYSILLGASSLLLVVTYPLMKRVTFWVGSFCSGNHELAGACLPRTRHRRAHAGC